MTTTRLHGRNCASCAAGTTEGFVVTLLRKQWQLVPAADNSRHLLCRNCAEAKLAEKGTQS